MLTMEHYCGFGSMTTTGISWIVGSFIASVPTLCLKYPLMGDDNLSGTSDGRIDELYELFSRLFYAETKQCTTVRPTNLLSETNTMIRHRITNTELLKNIL